MESIDQGWATIIAAFIAGGLGILAVFLRLRTEQVSILQPTQSASEYFNQASASTDYDRQIELYTRVLELEPGNAPAYNNRGFAYYVLGNYGQALLDFDRAIKLNSQAIYYSNKGLAYLQLRRFDQAIIAFMRAIKVNPDYADSYWGLGDTYYEQEQLNLALQNYCNYVERAEDPLQIALNRIDELGGCPDTES